MRATPSPGGGRPERPSETAFVCGSRAFGNGDLSGIAPKRAFDFQHFAEGMVEMPTGKPRGAPKGSRKGIRPPNAGIGRKPGVPNKLTRDVRELAQQYGPDAVYGLAIIAGLAEPSERFPGIRLAETESVQKGAMETLLDRAYGKASQPLEHGAEGMVAMGLIMIPPKANSWV
jgi:hypothetical protein